MTKISVITISPLDSSSWRYTKHQINANPIISNVVLLLLLSQLFLLLTSKLQYTKISLNVSYCSIALTSAIAKGYFINTTPTAWSNAPSTTTKDGKTVVLTTAPDPIPRIEVTWPNGTLTHYTPGGYSSKYRFIGSDSYLLLLDSSTGVGDVQHNVYVVDFNLSSEKSIISTGYVPRTVSPPNIHYSQGTGSAFLVFNPNRSNFENIGIYESDDGAPLCILYSAADLTGQILGEATGTELKIYYVYNGVTKTHLCPQ